MTNLESILKGKGVTLLTKVQIVKAMVFPVVMYGYKNWSIKKAEPPKNWCFWTVVLEKTLTSPLDCKEIQPVSPKGNQPWIGRTDAEAEAPILWPPEAQSQLTGKDPDAGKYWRPKDKGQAEDEMVRWHHWLNRHEFEQTPGDSGGHRNRVLQSMGSQRGGQDLVTEQQQLSLNRTRSFCGFHKLLAIIHPW